MSNIYHTEPATHGKVLLHTSFGDIDIELWGKECPKACRNFVQLAMEGVSERPLLRLCHDVLNTTQRESRADILPVAMIYYISTHGETELLSVFVGLSGSCDARCTLSTRDPSKLYAATQ